MAGALPCHGFPLGGIAEPPPGSKPTGALKLVTLAQIQSLTAIPLGHRDWWHA